jgi:PKD repeat protein
MKTKLSVMLILAATMLYFSSCKKTKEIIDCLGEVTHFTFNYEADSEDAKTIKFTIDYTGSHNLQQAVEWNFGDGTTTTVNGKTAEHTYSAAGTYDVRYKPTVKNGDETCSPEYEQTITVN